MQAQRRTLEIYIDPARSDSAYPVTARVLETSQIARSAMQLAIAADELATAQRWLAAGDGDVLVVQEFGARLFDSLFTGTVRWLDHVLSAESYQYPALWLVNDDIGLAHIL